MLRSHRSECPAAQVEFFSKMELNSFDLDVSGTTDNADTRNLEAELSEKTNLLHSTEVQLATAEEQLEKHEKRLKSTIASYEVSTVHFRYILIYFWCYLCSRRSQS